MFEHQNLDLTCLDSPAGASKTTGEMTSGGGTDTYPAQADLPWDLSYLQEALTRIPAVYALPGEIKVTPRLFDQQHTLAHAPSAFACFVSETRLLHSISGPCA